LRSIPYKSLFFVSLTAIIFWGCSTEKNTPVSRAYHNLTSYYNIYFNGREFYKEGMIRMDKGYVDNYTRILKPFKYSDETVARTVYPDMDKTIKKCSKMIKMHSITVKPKRKKGKKSKKEREFYAQSEYNKYVDDAYLLMGKAYFMKHDFIQSRQNFEFILREYPNSELRQEAYIWLARSFNEEKDYVKAREYLDLIEGDKNLSKKHLGDLYILYADYYLKQERYEEAVPMLQKAINHTRKKSDKTRYKFILAQVFQHLQQFPNATELYAQVIKANPPYDMAFSAKIRKASCFSTGYAGAGELVKELNKMLKDDKNIEYQDQIYYALAEVAMKQGNTDEALKNYQLSAEKSIMNTNQKALSFLAMADIYYKRPEYRNAYTYYDSTLFFIDPEYPTYDDIFVKTKSLTELVDNLNIIDREDSLQYVASLSEKERDALIQRIIDKILEEERKAKEAEQMAQSNAAMAKFEQLDPRNRNLAAGGKWYFYNPTALSFGQTEYVRLWGRRKLEDNWRRKNKEIVLFSDELAQNQTEESDTANMVKRPTDPKTKEFYLVDIPNNDSLIAISNQLIINAFFRVGEIYQNDLRDYEMSVSTFQDLNKRYPGNDFVLFTYYNMFKLFRELKRDDKANEYKSKIISEFPNSKYAQMFTNPNYLQELAGKEEQAKSLYEQTYEAYKRKNYTSVIQYSKSAETEYAETDLIPKFKFMKALSYGETGAMDLFVATLKEIIEKYPKSDVYQPARDIALRLKKDDKLKDKVADLNEEASGKKEVVIEEEIYFVNSNSTHLYVLAVPNKTTNVNRVKFEVSNFNLDFFSMTPLTVSSVLLSDDIQIVTVKNFPNARKAIEYLTSVNANTTYFEDLKGVEYRHFVISSDNFTTFFNQKDISRYMRFFDMNYTLTKE
jgi:tetratricopeptide (TPR) repeat protein